MSQRRRLALVSSLATAVLLTVTACSGGDDPKSHGPVTTPGTGGASSPQSPTQSSTGSVPPSTPTSTSPETSTTSTTTASSKPVSITMVMNGDLLLHNTLW